MSTGRKINQVVDDAVNFFRARTLSDRAERFPAAQVTISTRALARLILHSTQSRAIDAFLNQLKGIVEAARSQSTQERQAASTQFIEVGKQIFELVEDTSYQGLNLLTSSNSTLDVAFGVRTSSRLQVQGLNLNTSAADTTLGIFSVSAFFTANSTFAISNFGISAGSFTSFGLDNSSVAFATTAVATLDAGIGRLRGLAQSIGSNVAILQTRLDFTTEYVNELSVGSDKLTLADLNEEGANLVALQTRQQLGIQALSISGQQQQAILQLLN